MNNSFVSPPAGRLQAHRGASGLAPENTMIAFDLARRLGAGWIETDASLIGDGTVVLFHDDTLERCTDGRGLLAETSWDELCRLDAGSWFDPLYAGQAVPRLETLLDYAASHDMGINLELKTHLADAADAMPLASAVAAVLKARPAEALPKMVVSSFDWAAITAMQQLMPMLPRAMLTEEEVGPAVIAAREAEAIAVHAWYDHFASADAVSAAVAEIADAGLACYLYTVNDPVLAKPLWQAGLSGLISDFPNRFPDLLSA